MILNTYAILDAFICLVRLPVGLLVVLLAAGAWWHSRRRTDPDTRKSLEDRNYLLSQLALLLLVLNLVAWPLLYSLLQSYVPQWPGVMCVYGVTQIGAGSVGTSRFLPSLLGALQILKPLLVFVTGAWFVLYRINRRTETGPLLPRLFQALAVCGLLTVTDAGIELTYLVIPKQEETLATGCCAGAFEETAGFWGQVTEAVSTPEGRSWLNAAYYGSNLVMIAALFFYSRQASLSGRLGMTPLVVAALLSLLASGVFLVEVAAPTVLRLPYHHCPYDLIPRAPEFLVAPALFLGGVFCVGWASLAWWLGRTGETTSVLSNTVSNLLFAGFSCYLGSLTMVCLELALA